MNKCVSCEVGVHGLMTTDRPKELNSVFVFYLNHCSHITCVGLTSRLQLISGCAIRIYTCWCY